MPGWFVADLSGSLPSISWHNQRKALYGGVLIWPSVDSSLCVASPTVVVVAPEERIEKLLSLLGLYEDDRIVYTSFDPVNIGQSLGRRSIVSPQSIDFVGVEHVLIASFDVFQEYADVHRNLSERSFPR